VFIHVEINRLEGLIRTLPVAAAELDSRQQWLDDHCQAIEQTETYTEW